MATYVPLSLSDKMYDEVVAKVRRDYPRSCVLWIERVNNPMLREAYEARKASMEDPRELQLFHGTREESMRAICDGGFDATKNRVSAYGKGSYFATSAMYSQNYAIQSDTDGISFMLLCDVAVGRCCVGSSSMHIDTNKYDNAVDNLTKPKIYVTPYDDGAFPSFVVAFYKNAS